MTIFRLGDQKPPEPQRITDTVVMRFEHVYEVDPDLMQTTPQQNMPAWDTAADRRRPLGPPGLDARPFRRRGPARRRGVPRPRCEEDTHEVQLRACCRTTRSMICIEYIKTADELGFYACYSVDETWHKDLWVLFAAAARETKNIRFGPNVTHVFLREPTLICQQMATLDELTGGRTEIVVSTGNFGLLAQYNIDWAGPQAALAPEGGHARDAHLPRRGRDHVRGRLLQVLGPVHVRPAGPGQDPDQDGRDEGPALVPDRRRARRRHAPGARLQPRGLRLQLARTSGSAPRRPAATGPSSTTAPGS